VIASEARIRTRESRHSRPWLCRSWCPFPSSIWPPWRPARLRRRPHSRERPQPRALVAERLGYKRLWWPSTRRLPAVASSLPPVLIAHLWLRTSSFRIGSGGGHASQSRTSRGRRTSSAHLLRQLHRDAIDLGLGPAPGTDLRTAEGRCAPLGTSGRALPRRCRRVDRFIWPGADDAPGHPGSVPGPGMDPSSMRLSGSSLNSAQTGRRPRLPYSFAYHFSPALSMRHSSSTARPQPFCLPR